MQPRDNIKMQAGTVSHRRNPKPRRPPEVRAWRTCRGLRAWRARKETHETEEARRVPAALTARAQQEGRRNDKERRLTLRESDRLIVAPGNSELSEPTGAKEATREYRSTGNPIRMTDGANWANHSGAPDQRVLVKSPVRENRPPGSVRGAPGNRCPYLDTPLALHRWLYSCRPQQKHPPDRKSHTTGRLAAPAR